MLGVLTDGVKSRVDEGCWERKGDGEGSPTKGRLI